MAGEIVAVGVVVEAVEVVEGMEVVVVVAVEGIEVVEGLEVVVEVVAGMEVEVVEVVAGMVVEVVEVVAVVAVLCSLRALEASSKASSFFELFENSPDM